MSPTCAPTAFVAAGHALFSEDLRCFKGKGDWGASCTANYAGSCSSEYPILFFNFSTIEVEAFRTFNFPDDGSAVNELERFIQSIIPGHEIKRDEKSIVRFGTHRKRSVGIENIVVFHCFPRALVGMCKLSAELACSLKLPVQAH